MNLPNEEIVICADGRRLWRVLSNIYNNAAKYAMQGTRVYADLEKKDGMACFSLKNISARPLNIPASELTERFIAGDGIKKHRRQWSGIVDRTVADGNAGRNI